MRTEDVLAQPALLCEPAPSMEFCEVFSARKKEVGVSQHEMLHCQSNSICTESLCMSRNFLKCGLVVRNLSMPVLSGRV